MPARHKDVEITELENELVCYKPDTSEGYFLNPTAALVLKNCDPAIEKAHVVELLGGEESAQDLLELTLTELRDEGLLVVDEALGSTLTRADFLRKWTVAAALPVVAAIMMPTPAEASSACSCSCSCTTVTPPCTAVTAPCTTLACATSPC